MIIRILFALLFMCAPVWAGNVPMLGGGSTVTSGKTYILQDNFDGADGTNLYGWNNWERSDTDTIELDTAQYHGGSAALKLSGADTKACTHLFEKQSTGKQTLHLMYRTSSVEDTAYGIPFIWLSDGTWNGFGDYNWILVGRKANNLAYWNSGSPLYICSGCFSVDTWYAIDVEMDQDTKTLKIFLDGVQQGGTFDFLYPSINPDRITFVDGTFNADNWIDSLEIYHGERQ